MNFLEICQRVSGLSGMHGTMNDVTTTKDLQKQIALGVNEKWKSLQNLRKDWSFMIKRHTFTCTAGEEVYIPYNATSPPYNVGIQDLGTYRRRGIFLDNKPLTYISPDVFPFIDNTTGGKPQWFAIDPKNNNLYLDLPDDSYTFDIYYRKKVQDLMSDSIDPNGTPISDANQNWPDLPEQYHDILVYAGLAAFAIYIGDAEKYQEWSIEFEKIKGSLMREYVPSRTIKKRSII